jgi:hypothetical protein
VCGCPPLPGLLMNPFDLDTRVAAAIAAAGTVIGALAQLRVAWRKEVSERARGVPATKKSRRGPVWAVFLLLIAAAVAGFAFSQYFARQSDRQSAALRIELQTQLARISATAERLERVSLSDRHSSVREDTRQGANDVIVTTTLGPCRTNASGSSTADAAPTCSEQQPQRVTLCASVPSSAAVIATVLYARPEESLQSWTESRVAAGQDVGRARFAEKTFERAESDQTKQVCTGFSAWDGEQAYSARLVVAFVPSPPALEVSQAAVVPISDVESVGSLDNQKP